MGLLSFLKRKSNDEPTRPTKAAAAVADSPDTVQQARIRARQRLVGAVVLVAAGVIGFPLLFETQPRPLPGDLPIEIARKDGSAVPATAPRTTPAPRATPSAPPAVIAESPAESGREVVAAASVPVTVPVPAPAASVAEPAPKPAAEAKPTEPKPEAKPPAKPASKPADSVRAQALLEGRDAKPAVTAAADGRFIVQVGAFAEVTAAREARQKVEKLGLKTYTQVVETAGG
jgi:DedD protein